MRAIRAVVGLVVLLAAAASAQDGGRANPSLLKATLSALPIYFIENRGVYRDEVRFYVQGADKTLFFTRDGITFWLKGKDRGWVVKLEFVGANPDVRPRGEDRQQAVFSYFKGPEKNWKTGLRTYAKVVYEDLWPGIDLVYRGTVNRLKYEFVVRPGADPGRIRLRYEGATEVTVTEASALRVGTPVGRFEDEPPVAWQEIGATREPVEVGYALDENGRLGFDVAVYDRTRPLVLDPVILVYCGYIGGNDHDFGVGITVDATGCAYVAGYTYSREQTFPVKVGPQLRLYNAADAFVAKVNAQGTMLVYCGYIGGVGGEYGLSIAVDAAGNACVTGNTNSTEQTFPVKVGPDLTHNGGLDAFVAKVASDGMSLLYCGYIGGSGDDDAPGVAVDAAGNAFVAGYTDSTELTFPVTVGPDVTHNGATDAFVAKVNAKGTALTYCGYIGGSGDDDGQGIAVDAAGNAYVAGTTSSGETTFPVKVGPGLKVNAGSDDAFVAKVNAQGTALVYCGYIGGRFDDSGNGIAVDAAGEAYVIGVTASDERSFPVRIGPDLTSNGGNYDAFVAKVNAAGKGLTYCGYVGGNDYDRGHGISVDAAGNAYVTGATSSDEKTFPLQVGPDLTNNGGYWEAFVGKVNTAGTAFVYCGYIGGNAAEHAYGIAVDAAGNAWVTGKTWSNEQTFPVRVGPDLTYNGSTDAFVAMIGTVFLTGSGAPRPGGTVSLSLSAYESAGLAYQLGTSLGTGPIPIGTRKLNLSPDNLLLVTVNNYWPWIFAAYRGVIDSKGQATAAIHIPNIPALIGVRLHSAFVTLDPAAPSGIRSISSTFSFSITK